MLTENTVTKLQEMKLTAMARPLRSSLPSPILTDWLLRIDLVFW